MGALSQLVELTRQHGSCPIVVLVPRRDSKRLFEDAVLERLASMQVPTLDLSSYGFDHEDYFERDGHWTISGHRKVAAAIARLVAGPSSDDAGGRP
jgi:hypothetical protein